MASMVERPIAESIEYRPPTQSQNSNMFAVSIPNFATSSALVETATKCLATAFSSPPSRASSQARAVAALVIVSSVVNVFDETMNSVSAGSRSRDRLGEVGAVDVRDEAERQRALAVVLQRLVRHDRPEVGAADPDVDDVANPLAGVARATRRSGRGGKFAPC